MWGETKEKADVAGRTVPSAAVEEPSNNRIDSGPESAAPTLAKGLGPVRGGVKGTSQSTWKGPLSSKFIALNHGWLLAAVTVCCDFVVHFYKI